MLRRPKGAGRDRYCVSQGMLSGRPYSRQRPLQPPRMARCPAMLKSRQRPLLTAACRCRCSWPHRCHSRPMPAGASRHGTGRCRHEAGCMLRHAMQRSSASQRHLAHRNQAVLLCVSVRCCAPPAAPYLDAGIHSRAVHHECGAAALSLRLAVHLKRQGQGSRCELSRACTSACASRITAPCCTLL